MTERNHKTIISYEEAFRASRHQEDAMAIPLESKDTTVPLSDDLAIITCRARVAFQQTHIGEKYVVGIPWPAHGECIMSPNPSCRTCEVFKLEKKLEGKEITVSREKFDEGGTNIFLIDAQIDMKSI